MNWCLILNDFQTPPKKSMNSISVMHSFPLPWVFLQEHKVFYSHTQTDPATLDHLSTFFCPYHSLKVPCCPLNLRVQWFFPVLSVFTLDLRWGGGKQLEYFQIPSCCAFLGLRRPHGITILAAGRGQSRRVLGLESVQQREDLEQAEGQDEYLQYHSSTIIP